MVRGWEEVGMGEGEGGDGVRVEKAEGADENDAGLGWGKDTSGPRNSGSVIAAGKCRLVKSQSTSHSTLALLQSTKGLRRDRICRVSRGQRQAEMRGHQYSSWMQNYDSKVVDCAQKN